MRALFEFGLLSVFLMGGSLFEPARCDPAFTSEPKSREVFVGEDVQFDWGYSNDEKKKIILTYGWVNLTTDYKVVTRDLSNEVLSWNEKVDKSVRDRIKVKESDTGRKASMKIESVQMSDQKKYYCSISWDPLGPQPTSYVSLQVVDLQITDESHSTKDSWTGNEIIVNCMVKVADGVKVHFTWKRETDSENKTLSRDKHLDTETQSELTLNTDEDEDFGDLFCFARTPSTEKVHRIKIRRLYFPDPPLNLKKTRVFEKERSINRLYWDAPRNDGGSEVYQYVVQYKPAGIKDWKQAQEGFTREREFKELELTYGKTYNVRVRAVNRVGRSEPSNEMDVEDTLPDGRAQATAFGMKFASCSRTTLLAWCIMCAVLKLFFH